MNTFLRYVLMVSIAAVIGVPLLKMFIDWSAKKFSPLQPVATYVDKA